MTESTCGLLTLALPSYKTKTIKILCTQRRAFGGIQWDYSSSLPTSSEPVPIGPPFLTNDHIVASFRSTITYCTISTGSGSTQYETDNAYSKRRSEALRPQSHHMQRRNHRQSDTLLFQRWSMNLQGHTGLREDPGCLANARCRIPGWGGCEPAYVLESTQVSVNTSGLAVV
jgi:hypothetical protein